MRISIFTYDIAEVSGVANPSGRLRKAGCVRINKSVWMVRTDALPVDVLLALAVDPQHVEDFLIPVDDSANAPLLTRAARTLQDEIRHTLTGFNNALQREPDREDAKQLRSAADAIRNRIRELRDTIEAAEAGSSAFGLYGAIAPDLREARQIFEENTEEARQLAIEFSALARSLEASNRLRRAVEAGQAVPHNFLIDVGIDAGGQAAEAAARLAETAERFAD